MITLQLLQQIIVFFLMMSCGFTVVKCGLIDAKSSKTLSVICIYIIMPCVMIDLRGLLAAMKIVRAGLSPLAAVQMGVVNKTFDIFEKEIVDDVVRTRIPEEWTKDDVYA